ncbi:MAG TPA: protein kinase, partial [Polyangiaceae bacterium]
MGGSDDRSRDDSLLKAIARAPDAMPAEGAHLLGKRVGHFHVLRRLGAGGMGVVYEAEDERLGRRVALKVLPHGSDATPRARFVREAQNAAQLTHPNVAIVFEAGEDGDVAFIAMELIDGETLDAWVQTAPTTAERARVACEICSPAGGRSAGTLSPSFSSRSTATSHRRWGRCARSSVRGWRPS